MSGFQIPGLGFAKPDEKLPPLQAEPVQPIATTSASEDVEIQDADPVPQEQPKEQNTEAGKDSATNAPPEEDSMAIDEPASPPSLTDALEAALGGFDAPPQAQTAQPAQEQAPAQAEDTASLAPDQSANPEWEIDTSPYASSSSSSSSDSSDSDSDEEGYELLGVEETARLLMEAEGGSDDEGDKSGKPSTTHARTKNELPENVIPKPEVTILPEMKIDELGAIEHIVDNICLIKAFTPGEYQVLDTGSVLCTSERIVIGAIAEVIGKVLQPMYTVYFNSATEVTDLGLTVGSKIFYPIDHANFVFTEPLKNAKGSDASNLHDEEVAVDEMEFSDDEKEAEYKRAQKQKKRDKWKKDASPAKREPHPLRQEVNTDAGLNYDDDDGPYKPLARPPGFGEGPVSQEQEPSRSNFRGRGDSRGRGRGRGRGGRGGGPPRDGFSQPPQGQPQQQQYPQQQQPNQWNNAPPQGAPAPTAPNFGFQMPGWPAQPPQGGAVPPPPPPGWPGSQQQQQQGQGQGQAQNNMLNPAFFAALMSHMQQQQGGQQPQQNQWGGYQPPPQG